VKIPYRLIQEQKDSTVWESEVFIADTLTEICHAVLAGYVMGEARRAIDAEHGTVLYALDGRGNVIRGDAPR